MGYSGYNNFRSQSTSRDFATQNIEEIFSKHLDPSMDPKTIVSRECRNSEAHPASFPIILGLDVTGSMGRIPEHLIKGGLSTIVTDIIEKTKLDPAILFLALGDDRYDSAPLQVGQFEHGDTEMFNWLKSTWLEGGGGGNGGESYALAYHFAGNYVITDTYEIGKQKGVLITIGDEAVHTGYNTLNRIFNNKEVSIRSAKEMVELAKIKFDVYHIHCTFSNEMSANQIKTWEELIGKENLKYANSETDITNTILDILSNAKPLFKISDPSKLEPVIVNDKITL